MYLEYQLHSDAACRAAVLVDHSMEAAVGRSGDGKERSRNVEIGQNIFGASKLSLASGCVL